jgi:hypothetical protein
MIFKNIFAEKIGVFSQTTANFCTNLIICLEKNVKYFVENWQQTQKIAIITSTPGINVINGDSDHLSETKLWFTYICFDYKIFAPIFLLKYLQTH